MRYRDALALQHSLHRGSLEEYLLLLEHPHVYTLGVRTDRAHLLSGIESAGAEICEADRGGDVTYHGPGQLVGYSIANIEMGPGAIPDHVRRLEQLVIDVVTDLGVKGAGRLEGYPGAWLLGDEGPARKICAIGVRVDRGRSMHGFALNVDPDLSMFSHIVPCGLAGMPVTSLAAEGCGATMSEVIDAVALRAPCLVANGAVVERQDASVPASRRRPVLFAEPRVDSAPSRALDRRLMDAGVDPAAGIDIRSRKPAFVLAPVKITPRLVKLRTTMRALDLVTVCEEAGCPNIFECWADGTATYMINGERCTRACGFCLVDTGHPLPLDPDEPDRVARAVDEMALEHAVVTAVARDDLRDGGAGAFAATILAIRARRPGTAVEVLVPDFKGDEGALETVFSARPDVFNHNLETVLRLQRAVRPSASYARSLSVLARAFAAGLTTKSGLIVGMGEREDEVVGALADLRAVGVSIVTIGQYLRPSAEHLPVAKWWHPDDLARLAEVGYALGFAHVQASPLTRSSYHAKAAASAASAGPSSSATSGAL